jgi:allantoinase
VTAPPFVIRGSQVLTPDGFAAKAVVVENGAISAILDEKAPLRSGYNIIELGERVLMPGVVDTHAHINEPGRTEWEGFETATRAARAGGTTTVVDMPLNSIPATTTLEALELKAKAASERCSIDYGFFGGVVPGNLKELAPMVEAGALGFKCFLIESGVDEFKVVTERDLVPAMQELKRLGVPLLVHAELEGPAGEGGSERAYQTYLHSRPRDWENNAVRLMIRLAKETGCRTHIVHLSSSDVLPDLEAAQRDGVRISAETCPHYLTLAAEEIPDGQTQFKCAPPIRERENQDKLWQGLADGVIDFVVSDHSPCTPKLKLFEQGDFGKAWGGIASLQLSLSVVWTEAARRGLSLENVSRWMSLKTADFVGLKHKGRIAVGADADLIIFSPDAEHVLEQQNILHRHSVTPYLGRKLRGKVEQTFVRGVSEKPVGRWQRRQLG